MKKIISVLLSLLMVLSMAACIKLKTPETTSAKAQSPSEAAGTAAPAQATMPAPAQASTPAPTPVPTPEPTEAPTPEPTPIPFDAIIADANKKLDQLQSVHMDMNMNIDMELSILMGDRNQDMPIDILMNMGMDCTKDPNILRCTLIASAMGDESRGQFIAVQDGEGTILYSSEDNGVTWKKDTHPSDDQMPQSPATAFDLFADADADMQETGTAQVNGMTATVYTGTIKGKYLSNLLSSTGAAAELSESMGGELSEDVFEGMSDIHVTIMIAEENGMPIRYAIDMTDAMKDLMTTLLLKELQAPSLESKGITLEVSAAKVEMTLSQFDSVEPIVIPEAALNAPEK